MNAPDGAPSRLRVLVQHASLAAAVREAGVPVDVTVWDVDGPADPPDAEVLVCERPVDRARWPRVGRIPALRHVHLLSIGVEWVLPHLPDGVTLTNSRGAVEDSTAELAVGLLLAGLRAVPEAAAQQQRRTWAPLWGRALHGATVVVLGYGGVGSAVARRLVPFRPARIVPVATRARDLPDGVHVHGREELPGLLPTADAVVVTLPHDPTTERLVDGDFLARMPDGALLVNVGRGAVVDTAALVAELRTGRLRAALDVVEPEPLPADHPLWTAPGCLLTPHIGGNTDEFVRLATELVVEQVRRLAAGEVPLNVVVPGALDRAGR